MKDKRRIGGLGLDPAVAEWRKRAAENKAALTKKQRRDRARSRAHYDLSAELQQALQDVAKQEDTSISQVVEMFLWYALHHYRRGSVELKDAFNDGRRPARTPRFSWNYDPPDAWKSDTADAVQTFRKYWGTGE